VEEIEPVARVADSLSLGGPSDAMNADPFLVIMLPLGLVSLCYGLWQRRRELAPRTWSKVEGIIVTSRVEKQYVRPGRYQIVPVVEYEYAHGERIVRSSRRRMSDYSSGQRSAAETIILRYSLGSKVDILVDPANPASSVLEYGATPLSGIWTLLGVLFTGLAVFFSLIK
jgi:hypothetical protein